MNLVIAKRLVAFAVLNSLIFLLVPPEDTAGWVVFVAVNAAGLFLIASGVLIPAGRSNALFAYSLASLVAVAVIIQAILTTAVLALDALARWMTDNLAVLLALEVLVIGGMLYAALSVGEGARRVETIVGGDESAREFHRRAVSAASSLGASATSPTLKQHAATVQEYIQYSPVASHSSVWDLEALIERSLSMARSAVRAGDEDDAQRHLELCAQYALDRRERLRMIADKR